MSLQTKRKVAQALSVPLFYIKSKKPKQLLDIYRKCTRGILPTPPLGKYKFNGKIFLIPTSLPMGKSTYARVFLKTSATKDDMIKVAQKLMIKIAPTMKKRALKQAIYAEMLRRKIPEPVLFSRCRRSKKQIINTPMSLRNIPNVFRNDIRIREFVNNQNTPGNRTVTVKHISSKKNNGPQMPQRPRLNNMRNRTVTVKHVSSKKNNGPQMPQRPRLNNMRNKTAAVKHISSKKNNGPQMPQRPRLNNKKNMSSFITKPPTDVPGRPPLPPRVKPNTPNVPPMVRPNIPTVTPNVPPMVRPNIPTVTPNAPIRPPLPPRVRPNIPIVTPNAPIRPPLPPRVRPNTPGSIDTSALKSRIGNRPIDRNLKIKNLISRINQKNNSIS